MSSWSWYSLINHRSVIRCVLLQTEKKNKSVLNSLLFYFGLCFSCIFLFLPAEYSYICCFPSCLPLSLLSHLFCFTVGLRQSCRVQIHTETHRKLSLRSCTLSSTCSVSHMHTHRSLFWWTLRRVASVQSSSVTPPLLCFAHCAALVWHGTAWQGTPRLGTACKMPT